MGVFGLTTFMTERHKDRWVSKKVDNVAVDAVAFVMTLYSRYFDWKQGGDYTGFVEKLRHLLEGLKVAEVKGIFVFDGLSPPEKDETTRARRLQKRRIVQSLWGGEDVQGEGPVPPMIQSFAKQLVAESGFEFLTSDFEADAPLVKIARDRGAFIVSNDSDHMVMPGPQGFVRMADFVKKFAEGESAEDAIFPVLAVDDVAEALNLSKSRLPELATLCGNDYISREKLQGFHEDVGEKEHRQRTEEAPSQRTPFFFKVIQCTAAYLRRHDRETWMNHPCLQAHSTWTNPRKDLEYSIRSYSIDSTAEQVALDASSLKWSHQVDPSADVEGPLPAWMVSAIRTGPLFPASIGTLCVLANHHSPLLVEPISAEVPSVWECCLRLRQATASVFGVSEFEDYAFRFTKDGNVDYASQLVSCAPHPPHCQLSDPTLASFKCAEGPVQSTPLEFMEHFFAAFLWPNWREHIEPLAPVLPKSRWPQLAAVRYWLACKGSEPAWVEVATFLLMLLIPPDRRRTLRSDAVKPRCARPLAGYHACLICGLELHAALGEPCGQPDRDYMLDGPFFHSVAGYSKVDLGAPPLAEMLPSSRDFDVLLRALLASLAGRMKPVLRGSATGRASPWTFRTKAAQASQPAEQADAAQEKTERRLKQVNKLLAQIEKLEAKGGELSKDEQGKVGRKPDLQSERDQLITSSEGETDALKPWGVL
mmetsp:Transcript_34451/g.106989  ORF Transcript_34451/g.106989 Transcript_34451/m.106989 type:complete len:705 (-) Transcript_34451:152-2266(-)